MAIDTMAQKISTPKRAKPVLAGSPLVMPSHSTAKTVPKVPSMKISEWAKLMRRSTPYTNV